MKQQQHMQLRVENRRIEMDVVMAPPLVSTRQAAKAVGLNPFFLYRRIHEIPGVYRAGRVLRWDVEVLKKWMREQARTV